MIGPVPRLRSVEAFPVEQNGERYVALRDPAGYAKDVIMLPAALLDILALLDGTRDVGDIQAEIMRADGDFRKKSRNSRSGMMAGISLPDVVISCLPVLPHLRPFLVARQLRTSG